MADQGEKRERELIADTDLELVGPASAPTVLWTLCLLIATLSTVGVFLRLRTASLSELQLRLAALEYILVSRSETQNG